MTRHIFIQDDDYEQQYLDSKNFLNNIFHKHPTWLRNIPDQPDPRYDTSTNYLRPRHKQHKPEII